MAHLHPPSASDTELSHNNNMKNDDNPHHHGRTSSSASAAPVLLPATSSSSSTMPPPPASTSTTISPTRLPPALQLHPTSSPSPRPFSPPAPMLSPSKTSFSPTKRAHSRQYSTSSFDARAGRDSFFRSLSPSTTLRFFEPAGDDDSNGEKDSAVGGMTAAAAAAATARGAGEVARTPDERKLVESLRGASASEKALGVRVCRAAEKLRGWCREIERWGWAGSFEEPDEAEKRRQRQGSGNGSLGASGANGGAVAASVTTDPPLEYWGCLPAPLVEAYADRLDAIRDELADLGMDELKAYVRDMYGVRVRSRPGSAYSQRSTATTASTATAAAAAAELNLLDDFSLVVTHTVLQSLPYLSLLAGLLDSWTARADVLREAPRFLAELAHAQTAMRLGWEAIVARPDSSGGGGGDGDGDDSAADAAVSKLKETVGTVGSVLEGKVAALGRGLDRMLDVLEGREDVLPERWIDEFEALEAEYGRWYVEARRRIFEMELGRSGKVKRAKEEVREVVASIEEGRESRAGIEVDDGSKKAGEGGDAVVGEEVVSELGTADEKEKGVERMLEATQDQESEGSAQATKEFGGEQANFQDLNEIPSTGFVEVLSASPENKQPEIQPQASQVGISEAGSTAAVPSPSREEETPRPLKVENTIATPQESGHKENGAEGGQNDRELSPELSPSDEKADVTTSIADSMATSDTPERDTSLQMANTSQADDGSSQSPSQLDLSDESHKLAPDTPKSPKSPSLRLKIPESKSEPPVPVRTDEDADDEHESDHEGNDAEDAVLPVAHLKRASVTSIESFTRSQATSPLAVTQEEPVSLPLRTSIAGPETAPISGTIPKDPPIPAFRPLSVASDDHIPSEDATLVTTSRQNSPSPTLFDSSSEPTSPADPGSPSLRVEKKRRFANGPVKPPLNSFVTKKRAGPGGTNNALSSRLFPESARPGSASPPPKSPGRTGKNQPEDLDSKISDILTTIPASIRLTTRPEAGGSDQKSSTRSASNPYRPPSRPNSALRITRPPTSNPAPALGAPALTLSPAKAEFQPTSNVRRYAGHASGTSALSSSTGSSEAGGRASIASSGSGSDSDIKLYHLSQPGRADPIKLFVRRVGEHGERVMVRVGGGWADLGEFLRQYVEHHGRRTVSSEGRFEVAGQGSPVQAIQQQLDAAAVAAGGGAGGSASTSATRPQSARSNKEFKSSVGSGGGGTPSGGSGAAAPAPAAGAGGGATPGSGATGRVGSPESAASSSTASRHSWTGNEVGLAGPTAKKLELSGEKLGWVEGMMDKVKSVGVGGPGSGSGGVGGSAAGGGVGVVL
ncbi:hypothetical protein BDY21DRAFT_361217 [Lineolata rhizophorae]|uniref:GAR domain-containing protein n=1 Tax=Lineolata rhizophorae TaxID=578093 RepID=A0A6A6P8I8_9PEZI|nr:hypothetical protein BDY21DRAFT_361217 [Lineolata rhizophorae]